MGSAQSQPGLAEVATPLPSAILENAADLIAQPGAWIQGQFATDANGRPTGPRSSNAACWCAMGGVLHIVGDRYDEEQEALHWLRAAVRKGDPNSDIDIWNDAMGRAQTEVVAKIREAASLAREQEATGVDDVGSRADTKAGSGTNPEKGAVQ